MKYLTAAVTVLTDFLNIYSKFFFSFFDFIRLANVYTILANTSTGLEPQHSFNTEQTGIHGFEESDSVHDRKVFILRGRQLVEGRGQDRPPTYLLVPRYQHLHTDLQSLGHRRAHPLLWGTSNGTRYWVNKQLLYRTLINCKTTEQLGYNEHSYNDQPVIANKCFSPERSFYYVNRPRYYEPLF